jgi:hypothetical protein
MQKQQLISIKDAAISTGISEETIRKYIRSGKITGEKKNYIFWDEWFVSHGDLARIRDSVELEQPLQPTSVETGSLSSARNAASLVGAGVTAATDNGIKSNVNYSWMPDASHSHKFGNSTKFDNSSVSNSHHGGGSSRSDGTNLPASLAAEIERAFAPSTANEAFGARAYLEHSAERAVNDDLEGEREENSLIRESNVSKFSVNRPTGRRKRADQKILPQKVFEQKRSDTRDDQATDDQPGNNHRTHNPRNNHKINDPENDYRSNEQQTNIAGQSVQVQNPQQAPWTDYRAIAKTVAEEFLAPLLSRLESQAALLSERDKLIAEQAAQLRLLPYLQKASEEQRKLAEQKQQEALQLKQNLSWERKKSLIKISAWQTKHVKVERQLKAVKEQVVIIQEQKESEVNYLHCQLTQLQAELVKANKPWWKKIFRS